MFMIVTTVVGSKWA